MKTQGAELRSGEPTSTQRRALLGLFLAAALVATAVDAQNRTVLHVGAIVDGTHDARGPSLVTVEDGRITSITAVPEPTPEDVDWIDLSGLTLAPGLIDTHVHIDWHFDLDGRFHRSSTQETHAQRLLFAAQNAHRTLLVGVTTAQSLGAEIDLELRDLIAAGTLPGPRLLTSGRALFEGSGGPEELRQKVRELHTKGVDVIKLFASASIRVGGTPTMSQEQLDAACGEARALGRRVAVHAHGDESARRAARAGCTTIEHGALLSRETLEFLAETGTIYAPHTYLVLRNYFDNEQRYLGIGNYTAEGFEQMREAVPKALASFQEALEVEGLRIVFGTDAVAGAHGRNLEELVYRVEQGGQTPIDALRSATAVSAEALGLGGSIGQVAPGFAADLIAVDGDPSEDVRALLAVRMVMRDGQIVRLDPPPADD